MKTNLELVAYCKEQIGRPYWFGTFGQVATEKLLLEKAKQYPRMYSEKRIEKAKASHLGQKVHDCYGLYKGFLMGDVYDSKYDLTTDLAFKNSTENGTIDTLPEIEGIGLWKKGHFGVYIGNGREIEARGFDYGVVEDEVKNTKFTHWFKMPEIEYETRNASQTHEDAPVSSPVDSSVKTYTVQRGDNLSKIGAKFGISVADLVAWNKIKNPDLILAGQVLILEGETIDPPKEGFKGIVATQKDSLNIRKGSGMNFPVIGSLPKGAEIRLAYETGGWCKLEGREGFVSAKFIKRV